MPFHGSQEANITLGSSDIHISLTNSLWTVRRWRTQESLKENVRLQIEHLNGLSPVCVFQCLNDYCDGGLNQQKWPDVKKSLNIDAVLSDDHHQGKTF